MEKNIRSQEGLDEQIREVTGEEPVDDDSDDERTVNTQDFGNQNESDIKPGEVEEMIDEEEDRRMNVEEE